MGRKNLQRRAKAGSGSGYVFRLGMFICLLLLLNVWAVEAWLSSYEVLKFDKRVTQAIQFAVPMILLVFEIWIYDFVVSLFRGDT